MVCVYRWKWQQRPLGSSVSSREYCCIQLIRGAEGRTLVGSNSGTHTKYKIYRLGAYVLEWKACELWLASGEASCRSKKVLFSRGASCSPCSTAPPPNASADVHPAIGLQGAALVILAQWNNEHGPKTGQAIL